MLLSAAVAVWAARRLRAGKPGELFCRALAVVLALAVLADPIITWLRYSGDPTLAARLVHETAWPLYLCDWAALASAVALWRKSQRLAEISWCWGLGGTLQGLVYPTSLSYDWPNPDYFAFFAEHGGVPVAAITLALGMRLAPQPGVVWRAWFALLGYLVVAGLANAFLQKACGFPTANYGFVCSSDYSPFAMLGPWPWYVLGMAGGLFVCFTALTAPFVGWRALAWKGSQDMSVSAPTRD
jgi:hypothetical integral membrane protein (TIGR02206 family)